MEKEYKRLSFYCLNSSWIERQTVFICEGVSNRNEMPGTSKCLVDSVLILRSPVSVCEEISFVRVD